MNFNAQKARQSLYLDFEGEGRSSLSHCPMPHMLGIFRPHPVRGGSGKYEAVFFNETWTAPVNGSSSRAHIAEFEQTINNLIALARERDGCLVYWSDHERHIVEQYAPKSLEAFNEVGFNLLPALRKLKNKRNLMLDESIDKVLNQYLNAFIPKRPLINECRPGPAEACRRIDQCTRRYTRWGRWPNPKKQYVLNLLSYNEKDCRATWWLAKKLGNINK